MKFKWTFKIFSTYSDSAQTLLDLQQIFFNETEFKEYLQHFCIYIWITFQVKALLMWRTEIE